MNEQQERKNKVYKIEIGDTITVFRRDITYQNGNQQTFYSSAIKQKQQDGTDKFFYKPIRFKKGVEIKNKSKIKINSMFENIRENPNDKYNAIYELFIMDYDLVSDGDAYQEYHNETANQPSIKSMVDINDVELGENDLPF